MRNGFMISAAALLFACAGRYGGETPPADRFFYPTALGLHPGGRFLYVASSNFDLGYQAGTVLPVDLWKLDELLAEGYDPGGPLRGAIMSAEGVMTDSFAGKLLPVVYANGKVELFLTVRGSNTLQRIEVDTESNGRHLKCFDAEEAGLARCADTDYWSFKVEPDDPFGLAPVKLKTLTPGGESYIERTYVMVSCLRNEEIIGIRADNFSESFSFKTNVPGFSSIVTASSKGKAVRAFATGRYSDVLLSFAPQAMFERYGEVERSALGVEALSSRDYARDMTVSPDGSKVYVAMRAPDGIAVLDAGAGAFAGKTAEVAGFIQLECGPSQLAYLQREHLGMADLLYATCINWSGVYVISLRGNEVAARILDVGHAPFAIAAGNERVFVANFEDGTVAVIDSRAEDPREHLVSARIGGVSQ